MLWRWPSTDNAAGSRHRELVSRATLSTFTMGASASTVPLSASPQSASTTERERQRSSVLCMRLTRLAAMEARSMSADSSNYTSRGSVAELGPPRGPRTSSISLPPELVQESEATEPPKTREPMDRRETMNGPTESTLSASKCSLLGKFKRRLSDSKLTKQQPAAVRELLDELRLVKRNILSNKSWIDGVSVMWIVVSNTITSVLIAWFVAFFYAVGSPIAPQSFAHRRDSSSSPSSTATLLSVTAVGAYFVAFACLGHAVTKSYILAERLLSVHVEFRHALIRTLSVYFRGTAHLMILATLAGAGFTALLYHFDVDHKSLGWFEVVGLCAIASIYLEYAILHARKLRQRMVARIRINLPAQNPGRRPSGVSPAPSIETIGAALDSSAHAVPVIPAILAPYLRFSSVRGVGESGESCRSLWQRLARGGRGSSLLSFASIFGYVHLARVLRLDQQWEIMLFAALSVTLKIAIQEVTKRVHLPSSRKPSARRTHMIMSLPTVMIDAQIRMVFVQLGQYKSKSSAELLATSFIIVLCKICFRVVKIMRLRATITRRLTHSKGMQRVLKRVNSKIALRAVALARAEYSQFLDWKNYKLRLHAAEVYADMHGEYISLGLSMAVVFFLSDHPMYSLRRTNVAVSFQMLSAVIQITTGLVFDYFASVVEGIHDVPLYEAIGDEGRSLRVFMHVLLGAITTVNVGIVSVTLRGH